MTDQTAMQDRDATQVVQDAYAAFGRGDVPALLGYIAPDAEWTFHGPADAIPYAGDFHGPDGPRRFFERLAGSCEFQDFQVRDMFACGDRVVVRGFESIRGRATGKACTTEWVHLFTVRDGRIVKFEEFQDTAALVSVHQP